MCVFFVTTFFFAVLFFPLCQIFILKRFAQEINELLECPEMMALVTGGWELKVSLSSLFKAACSGQRSLKFETSNCIDANSRGLFAYLVNMLRQAIASSPEVQRAGFSLEAPHISAEDRGGREYCISRFVIDERTKKFLDNHFDLLSATAKLVYPVIYSRIPHRDYIHCTHENATRL